MAIGAGETITLEDYLSQEMMAAQISSLWLEWTQARQGAEQEWMNTRNYLFATDTSTTVNSSLPWKNKTIIPKLTQIYDNLYANYAPSLFSGTNWLDYDVASNDEILGNKRRIVREYMRYKVEQSGFVPEMLKCLGDWIETGNCFALTDYCVSTFEQDGETHVRYVGAKAHRISPYDIAFNPLAETFEASPKIIRRTMTLGDLAMLADSGEGYYKAALDKTMEARRSCSGGMTDTSDVRLSTGMAFDGYGTLQNYLLGDTVELLDFYGNIFDKESGKLLKNRIVTVVDRLHVVREVENPSWLGIAPIRHHAWRKRRGNLYGMSPLANLISMQYRINHLENLKADVFDLLVFPIMKIKGQVDAFTYMPGGKIFIGDEGDVTFERPDSGALTADMQIEALENKMEEMAGAPKQAMGFRTPGEKTKFEVQTLETAGAKIFQTKITEFERDFVEPVLNDMLESSRRNLNYKDVARIAGEDDVYSFQTVTRDEISGTGKLVARGARHSIDKAIMLQNIVQLSNTAIMQDPLVRKNFSTLKLARLIESAMDTPFDGIVEKDVRIVEQVEAELAEQKTREAESLAISSEVSPEEMMLQMDAAAADAAGDAELSNEEPVEA